MRGYDTLKSKTRRLSLSHLPQTSSDRLLGMERGEGREKGVKRGMSHLTVNVSDNPLGACHCSSR